MSYCNNEWQKAILTEGVTLNQAISNLDNSSLRIVMVVNDSGKLEGTISDGDIRRGLIRGLDLNSGISSVINRNPLVVPDNISRELIKKLMAVNKIHQIPVVDEDNCVVGLHLWDEISTVSIRPNWMVIMAGGLGKRLLPFTEDCPKPLLSVAGKPMLEHIIEQAKLDGFNHFVIAINYLGHMIEDYFGNGERLDVEIKYLREDSPLGTAGALALLDPKPNHSFIVTNGDVITDIRYGELLDFHARNCAIATMAVRVHEWQHPFGVVQTEGVDIIGFEEKPVIRSHINAGVYALDVTALNSILKNTNFDMPSLFDNLRLENKKILAYPMHEPWLDVGRPEDLLKARNEVNL